MHELSLAVELLRHIEKIAAREGAARVVAVEVEIGALSGVYRGAFEFVFPLAAEGTVAEGADLRVHDVPVRVRCRACGAESAPEVPLVVCQSCRAVDVAVIAGQDFLLRSLEVT